MDFYKQCLFPLLRQIDPEQAHNATAVLLRCVQAAAPGRALLRAIAGGCPARPVQCCGLTFPNVLGIAAGFDKDVHLAPGLAALGFGHIETGTLTPLPQPGNPRPRVFRLPEHAAIINRMGFPNGGVEAALPRLRRMHACPGRRWVLGVSLGKQKTTALADAAADYRAVMRAVEPVCDYLAVNISSPNTPGLRELQGEAYLRGLLGELCAERDALARARGGAGRPLLVKIAPDLTDPELDAILAAVLETRIDGLIATNTTLAREAVAGHPRAGELGGLSGRPLAAASTALIAKIRARAGARMPVIGVGGVATAADVREKLEAGATLVQLYTGLVYQGPAIAGRILRDLNGS